MTENTELYNICKQKLNYLRYANSTEVIYLGYISEFLTKQDMNIAINSKDKEQEKKEGISSIEISIGTATFHFSEKNGIISINKKKFNDGRIIIMPIYVNHIEIC